MKNTQILLVIVIVVILFALFTLGGSFYIVDESEQVVITQFGKIIGDPIDDPGLHFKMPFIHDANYFDKRLLDWEGEKTVSKTKEQKFISVEVYARWRITNPKLFLQTVSGRIETAMSRLDALIDPVVRDVIARYTLNELVRSDTEKAIIERTLKDATKAINQEAIIAGETSQTSGDQDSSGEDAYDVREIFITQGRDMITKEIFDTAKAQVTRFGIELADVRMIRINYQPETRAQVFKRMIAERNVERDLYISQGEQKAAEIRGKKEFEIKKIQADAAKRVLEIKGEADAEAIMKYANAYSKDPPVTGKNKQTPLPAAARRTGTGGRTS
jgi:membrane protease subunit HflC